MTMAQIIGWGMLLHSETGAKLFSVPHWWLGYNDRKWNPRGNSVRQRGYEAFGFL